jgi:hypothetical protein
MPQQAFQGSRSPAGRATKATGLTYATVKHPDQAYDPMAPTMTERLLLTSDKVATREGIVKVCPGSVDHLMSPVTPMMMRYTATM